MKLSTLKMISGLIGLFTIGLSNHAFSSGLMFAKGADTDAIDIRSHDVTVNIENGYAITEVEQTFYNHTDNDLEATYEFPVPKNGTVAEFTVWIDGQPVIGEVLEKQKANEIYAKEKQAGNDTGIANKELYKRFEVSVYPVRPQQLTRTRIVYMQPADVEGGIGRYVYPLQDNGVDEDKSAFWESKDTVDGQFTFNLNLHSQFPVDALRLPQHPAAIQQKNTDHHWQVSLNQIGKQQTQSNKSDARAAAFANTDEQSAHNQTTLSQNYQNSLNQDVVVYWRLAPDLPGDISLVTSKKADDKQGTFMMTVTPGIDLKPITKGRDWVFVLDKSGSMSTKLATLIDATESAINKLPIGDRFRVIFFSDSATELTRGWTDGQSVDAQQIIQKLQNVQVDGGTNLYDGIKSAIRFMDKDRTTSIVLVTDGVANLGKTARKEFIDLMQKNDVRLFTAIMGNGANRPLLEHMTRVSNGFAQNISNSDDISGMLLSALNKVNYESLRDIEVKINGIKTHNVTPNDIHTLYRGQQLVIFGHYFGSGDAQIEVNAKIGDQDKSYQTNIHFPAESLNHPEIERLWAYAYIQHLKDKAAYFNEQLDEYRSEIVDLAVKYSLVTDFTSMLVLRPEQYEKYGIKRDNQRRRLNETQKQQLRRQLTQQNKATANNANPFPQQQASYSQSGGAGSFNLISLLFLLPFILTLFNRKR